MQITMVVNLLPEYFEDIYSQGSGITITEGSIAVLASK